ncbi:hypothetical protein ACLOJK_025067 [Asimina triloba]
MIRWISPRFGSISTISKAEFHAETDPNLLSLLNRCSTFKHMIQAHAFMVSRGLDQDNIHLSNFIHICSLFNLKDYALSVFTQKTHPDIYIYNTMIKALSQMDSPKEAILLYNRIQAAGFRPDTYSFPFALKAVMQISALEVGREIHGQIIRIGLRSEVHILTGLIQMYSACCAIGDARQLFDGMRKRDVVVWNAMVAGYAKMGDMENATSLFEQMPERNVISWTAMISGYAQMNRPNEAIEIFHRMQLTDIEPDEISMLAVLSACADLGALELGEWAHNYINKHRLNKIVPLRNALIDMYAKSGNIGKALEVFKNMEHRSVITWTTMIAGLALHGLGVEALDMFSRMERARIKPNEVTFIAILSACSHVGLVHAGRCYFNIMTSHYRITPKIEHYGCMVDLLGRAGYLQEVQDLVKKMPFEANGAVWGSMLAASRIHGNLELGEWALRHLIEVEPHNSGNYTLLSNIYAAYKRWDDVRKLRKLMRDRGVKKMPGGSSIEVNGTVHDFIVGDNSHSQYEGIYRVLYEINLHLKTAGYVPKVSAALLDFEEG